MVSLLLSLSASHTAFGKLIYFFIFEFEHVLTCWPILGVIEIH